MNKRLVGTNWESFVCEYLISNGVTIIERNYRNRFGEIDIIARDSDYIIFVEVKYRKTAALGHPEEAVNYKKAKTICKVADYYRISKVHNPNAMFRFDVIAIEGEKITWHKNAFSYMY